MFLQIYWCRKRKYWQARAPLKKATRKKRKLINKPWITKGILISIKKKQKLYAKCYKSGSEFEKWLYKIYANKLTDVKRLSKKLFLQQEIVNSRHDMRKFWGIMKTLLPNNQELNSPDFVNVEGTKCRVLSAVTMLLLMCSDHASFSF